MVPPWTPLTVQEDVEQTKLTDYGESCTPSRNNEIKKGSRNVWKRVACQDLVGTFSCLYFRTANCVTGRLAKFHWDFESTGNSPYMAEPEYKLKVNAALMVKMRWTEQSDHLKQGDDGKK